MKLYISEPHERHAGPILVHDEALNDIAEFYHDEHATVGQTYETALMLANALIAAFPADAQPGAQVTPEMVDKALNAWFASPPSETDQGLERSMRAALEAALVVKPTLTRAIEAEARRYAEMYPQSSDGRNTFVIFADEDTEYPIIRIDNMTHLKLTQAEIQSNHSRQKWAEGLISQLPPEHDGRNSWLMNFGVSEEAQQLRRERGLWFDPEHQAVSPGHIHIAGTTVGKHIDECAKCGFDLRHPIHAASARR